MLTLKNHFRAKTRSIGPFLQFSFCFIVTFFYIVNISAQTYTTVQDGDWSDNSTWGGTAPGNDLTDMTIIINHNVNHDETLTINKNTTLSINNILNLTSGSIQLEKLSSTLELNFALLIVVNGGILNKKGVVRLTDGGIQIGNGNYTDESNSINAGTLGNGYIYVNNGNIENKANIIGSNATFNLFLYESNAN